MGCGWRSHASSPGPWMLLALGGRGHHIRHPRPESSSGAAVPAWLSSTILSRPAVPTVGVVSPQRLH